MGKNKQTDEETRGGFEQRLGLYVHIPFCERKCAYCDFPSYAGQKEQQAPYVDKLCAEIRLKGEELNHPQADTVFLGGGTPSVLPPDLIGKVLEALRDSFNVLPGAEITCEANPGTLTPDFLMELREKGVNRLSLGAQSVHRDELKLLSRIHDWDMVVSSVHLAREMGFSNINLDLMSALPGQTWDKLQDSLQKAVALKPAHLSCYSLIVEEGTPFHALFEKGQLNLPDEETEREMYHKTAAFLEQAGYQQYEISNFCLPGFECRHNKNCWLYRDYLGFGLSAASLFRGVRQKNPDTLSAYLDGLAPMREELTGRDMAFEQVMLGLRLREGVSAEAFKKRRGQGLFEVFPKALERHIEGGLLAYEKEHLFLTRKGLDLMDRVLLDLMPD